MKIAYTAHATANGGGREGLSKTDDGRDDGEGFGLEVTLDVNLLGMDKAAAEDLAARGHIVRPYSHSIKGNVKVTTNVSV